MKHTDRYLPNADDSWTWQLATAADVADIVAMAQQHFEREVQGIFTTNPEIMREYLDVAITRQKYRLNQQQIIRARSKTTEKLLAYAWLDRGHYTVYAPEEIADARFAHVDLELSVRDRVRLCAQIIQQWILWTHLHQIPVLVSSSIRHEQTAFLRLHDRFGFKRSGSVCYLRVEDFFRE